MKTTIKDIAKEAGVSIATVSHVINKTRYVIQELIEHVEKAIEKTDYVSKKIGSVKNRETTKIISLVIPEITSRFFAVISKTIENLLKKENYRLMIHTYNKDKEDNRVHHILSPSIYS